MKNLVCIRSEDSWVGILSAWLFFIIVKTEIKKVNNQFTTCVRYDNIKTEKIKKRGSGPENRSGARFFRS